MSGRYLSDGELLLRAELLDELGRAGDRSRQARAGLGELVAEAALNPLVSLAEVARAAGVARSTVRRWRDD